MRSRVLWLPLLLLASISLVILSGCGLSTAPSSPSAKYHGSVHGGQQPVSGATIQLYTVGTSGDGSAATQILTTTVKTGSDGGFELGGTYTCPSATALVYIVATGGNPGLSPGTNNLALDLMAALGQCGTLTNSTFISIDEVTTVAAVYALAPFMNSYSSIGSALGDASSLAASFANASQLVNYTTGTSPGSNLPLGKTVPVAQINTLANILSTCVNSGGGVAGDNTICGTLFTLTTSQEIVPTNTIGALLNLANDPSLNTQALFDLDPPYSPFQPQLSVAPSDFSVALIVPNPLQLSSSSIAFPNTIVGFSSSAQLTLTNTGQTPIVLIGVSFPDSSPEFLQKNNCPTTLDALASCIMSLTFTPSALGARNDTLFIISSATNTRMNVTLFGDGITGTTASPVTATPSQLTFGAVNYPQTVTITNQGSRPLAIGGIYVTSAQTGANSFYAQTNNCGIILQPQSICVISVSATGLAPPPNGNPQHRERFGSRTSIDFLAGNWNLWFYSGLCVIWRIRDRFDSFSNSNGDPRYVRTHHCCNWRPNGSQRCRFLSNRTPLQ